MNPVSFQRIGIVGTGAMGSVYAAHFAEAGHEVWTVDVWAEHVAAINRDGLRVDGTGGDRRVRNIRAVTSPGKAPPCDLYILSTKANGVAAAARAIAPLLHDNAVVLTIQNGLGAGERIAAHLPAERILLGVADGFGASIEGPGHVHHAAMKLIRIGELGGGESARLEAVAALWREAGFNLRAFPDIAQLIWEKFLCNVTNSAPCTVFDCTVGELMSEPELWRVACGCLHEAYRLGQLEHVAFSFDDPEAYVTAFNAGMPNARPSMLLDHEAGRRSEIDAINGMVPVLGRRHGIATPYNGTMSAIVRRREAAFDR